MSSSNHNARLHFNTQPANQPHLMVEITLPIYIRPDEDEGHFLNNVNVPRKRRSASLRNNKTKPTSTTVSTNEDTGPNEIPTVTKILIGTCFAAILTPQIITHSTSTKLVFLFEWVAILSMMVGMYIQGKRPKLSKWLQRFGHLNCLVGLMLTQGSTLQLPVTYAWIPPVAVALILGAAMFYQA